MLSSVRSAWPLWHCLVFMSSTLSVLASLVGGVSAENNLGHDHAGGHTEVLARRASSSTFPLTILPVGDSITEGYRSTDDNGYRLELKNLLKADWSPVQFIGSRTNGQNNPENQHEGFGTYRINQILGSMQKDLILLKQPNLVLLHAGTNDNIEEKSGETFDEASKRLEGLLDFILCNNPTAVILLAMLIENKLNTTQTLLFNGQIPAIVRARVADGYHVGIVDMTGIKGDELIDFLHPSDSGYRHMARNWYSAIQAVPDNWWVAPGPTLSTLASTQGYCLARPKAIDPEQLIRSSAPPSSSSSSTIITSPSLNPTGTISTSSPAVPLTASTSSTASASSTTAMTATTSHPTPTTQASSSSRSSSTSPSNATIGLGSAATRSYPAAASLSWMILAMLLALK